MNRIKQNFILVALMTMFIVNSSLWSQDTEEDSLKLKFKFEPESIQFEVGDTVIVKIQLLNEAGEIHKMPFILFARGAEARKHGVGPRARREWFNERKYERSKDRLAEPDRRDLR